MEQQEYCSQDYRTYKHCSHQLQLISYATLSTDI